MRSSEAVVDDYACNIIQHTGYLVRMRLEASILAAEDSVENEPWIGFGIRLHGTRGHTSGICSSSLAHFWELEIVITLVD